MNFLVDRGISEERLDSEGFGETKPIASNDTRQGRAANRRTEFVLKEINGKPVNDPGTSDPEQVE